MAGLSLRLLDAACHGLDVGIRRTTVAPSAGDRADSGMPRTWFTADTHFGHAAIIRLCARPFASAGAMDAALVAAWNAVVQPGDFAFRAAQGAGSYLARLTGRVHLVWGNHDGADTRTDPGFASAQAMAELVVNGQALVLCHYAMRVWPGSHRGALHLFGHSHGTLPGDSQCCDVGVDVAAFRLRPVSLDEVRRHLAQQPARVHPDHHGRANAGRKDADL